MKDISRLPKWEGRASSWREQPIALGSATRSKTSDRISTGKSACRLKRRCVCACEHVYVPSALARAAESPVRRWGRNA
jgi:hypothetical protein